MEKNNTIHPTPSLYPLSPFLISLSTRFLSAVYHHHRYLSLSLAFYFKISKNTYLHTDHCLKKLIKLNKSSV